MSVLLLLSATSLSHAAQPAPKVDAELLEFLGSVDGDEEGWREFLEQMPVKRTRAASGASRPDSSSTIRTPVANEPAATKGTPPAAGGQGKPAHQDAAKVTEK